MPTASAWSVATEVGREVERGRFNGHLRRRDTNARDEPAELRQDPRSGGRKDAVTELRRDALTRTMSR